eukprot:2788423-Lingulodinium_polyedra.AAC.1
MGLERVGEGQAREAGRNIWHSVVLDPPEAARDHKTWYFVFLEAELVQVLQLFSWQRSRVQV